MYVVDKQGAQWSIDEGLRKRAQDLMQSFDEDIGHVNLDQVIFLRLSGSKATWHGKCFYIGKAPMSIIARYVAQKLLTIGVINLNGTSLNVDSMGDLFDLRFIIAINDDSIQSAHGDIQRVEDVTLLHELMHIDSTCEKLVKHDLEDFKSLVDRFGAHWTEGIFQESYSASDGVVEEEPYQVALQAFQAPVLPPGFVPVSGSAEDWNPEESR
jgi:hypothetical protein